MPKISIVIPAYNAEVYLAETVESVLAQTVSDWELIMVDDGSRDSTRAVAEAHAARDPRICVLHQANSGQSASRNRGYAASDPDSEYVIFLDADDLWEADALESLLAGLEMRPEALGAYGLARYIDSEGKLYRPGGLEAWGRNRLAVEGNRLMLRPLDAPADFAMFAFWHRIATPGAILLRRSALEAVGPFDTRLPPCEDYDMWLRLTLRGDFTFVDRVVINYRRHAGGDSQNLKRMDDSILKVRRKLFTLEMTPEQRRIAQLGYRFWEQRRAGDRIRWARESLLHGNLLQAAKHLRHAAICYLRSVRGIAGHSLESSP